jgi:hypothetical protein
LFVGAALPERIVQQAAVQFNPAGVCMHKQLLSGG